MIKSNYIVFDTETGGLDETKNPITQYAAVVLDGCNFKEIDRWETFIRPYNDLVIDKNALEHTMVTMSDINKGMKIKDFVATAKIFWGQHLAKTKNREMGRLIPVGHNVPFDIRFINYALEYCGEEVTINNWHYPNFIDTLTIAKITWGVSGDERLNLGSCCERSKIKLTDAHGAMNDVEATADLLRFFMKKLRAKKGGDVSEMIGRARGNDFFEFKCAVK